MKRILAILLISLSPAVFAQHHHHGHGHWHHRSGPNPWVWVAPTLIGGVIGYEIARNQTPVIVQPPPVIVQQQNCTAWTEVRNSDGSVTITRTCSQ